MTMKTEHLMVDGDGSLYEFRTIESDGEDADWVRIGTIDSDYEVDPAYLDEYLYLHSEYRDWRRQDGEMHVTAMQAWETSRGRF